MADQDHIVLFMDPMHQVHNNENDYLWQFKGGKYTKTIGSNSARRRLNIIGALNPVSLHTITVLTESNCNKELIIAYLKHIKEHYPKAKSITIILDNASYNRAYKTADEAEKLGIKLMFLPPYAPNLNLIERLWKFFKKKVVKNKFYPQYDLFYKAVEDFFINYHQYKEELESLLTFKFGIIKTV